MGSRARRIVIVGLSALGVLTLLWVCAIVVLNRPSVLRRIDEQVASRARVPHVEVHPSPLARISWLGCAELPSVRASYRYGERAFETEATGLSVCPRLTSLAIGRLGPRSISADEIRIGVRAVPEFTKDRTEQARLLMAGLGLALGQTQKKTAPPPMSFRVRVGALRLEGLELADKLGPLRVEGRLRSSVEAVDFKGVTTGGSPPTLPVDTWVRYDRAAVRLTAQAAVADFPFSRLPFPEAEKLFQKGKLTVRVHAEATAFAGTVETTVEAIARDLVARSPRLAADPVGPLTARLEGKLAYDIWSKKLALLPSTLEVNGVAAHPEGEILFAREKPFRAEIDAGPVDYRSALEALPAPLRPPDSAVYAEGPLTFHAKLSGPAVDPERWVTEIAVKHPDWKRRPGSTFDPAGPFLFRPPSGQGAGTVSFEVGPGNPSFVPLSRVSPYLVRAILLSEDSSFYGHAGFDFQEMALALGRNVREARAARGGSTITQQLAKNLFLDREKTYARKAKEAVLALELEATLSKSRILEIYLNVIEWGPGIRGIGPAARHYFAKAPSDLTPKEAVFLATIIPNPVRYHIYYDQGGLTERWEARVRELLAKLRSVGAISDGEYEQATATPLVFARG